MKAAVIDQLRAELRQAEIVEKPWARAAAITGSFGALPLQVAWRLIVPTAAPS